MFGRPPQPVTGLALNPPKHIAREHSCTIPENEGCVKNGTFFWSVRQMINHKYCLISPIWLVTLASQNVFLVVSGLKEMHPWCVWLPTLGTAQRLAVRDKSGTKASWLEHLRGPKRVAELFSFTNIILKKRWRTKQTHLSRGKQTMYRTFHNSQILVKQLSKNTFAYSIKFIKAKHRIHPWVRDTPIFGRLHHNTMCTVYTLPFKPNLYAVI